MLWFYHSREKEYRDFFNSANTESRIPSAEIPEGWALSFKAKVCFRNPIKGKDSVTNSVPLSFCLLCLNIFSISVGRETHVADVERKGLGGFLF